jgi:dipeptidyl-peptidase-4
MITAHGLRSLLLSLSVLALAGPVLAAAPPAISYDAIFAADFGGRAPDKLAWSPDGRRLTYLLADDRGTGLWSLDPASGTLEEWLRPGDLAKAAGRQDDPEISGYQWSPRGDHLLLEVDGDLYLLAVAGHGLRRLTSTEAAEEGAQLSPDGSRVAFARAANLYVMDIASGREEALTTDGKVNEILNGVTDWLYWEEIWDRKATGFWWSPDSQRIAYYRFDEREVPSHPLVDSTAKVPEVHWQKYPTSGDPNPKVRIGVLELATRRTTWMETGDPDQYLARADWTPDGRGVAIQALSRSQARLDLLRCEAADGRCGTLVTESWPTWVNLGDDLRFLPDGRFVWGSERTGRRRLYLYNPDGRLVRQVSPDGWVVTAVNRVPEVDDKDPWVVFTGYRADGLGPLDRQVASASLLDARFQVITPDAGEHTALVAPRTGHWVHTWSTVNDPGRSEVRLAGTTPGVAGAVVPLPWTPPSKYDLASLPRYEFLAIPSPDGVNLPARLLKPAGFDPSRRYPVIVYQYGGPGSQTVVNKWDTRRRDLFHRRLAQLGFAVLTVDGRSTAFFGKEGEDLDYRKMGEINLAAQLAGVEYLKTQRWADMDRLGLWGWSGGGTNTLFCMLSRPGVWKAGVAGAPVTDWHLYDSAWTERYLDTPNDNEAGFLESSPINLAGRLKDRLLIVHGLADDNVHPQNTVNMIDELVKAGRPVEQAFYPGEKHGMRPPAVRHFFERMEELWVRTLQGIEIGDVEVR